MHLASPWGPDSRIPIAAFVDLLITPPDDARLLLEEIARTHPATHATSLAPGVLALDPLPSPSTLFPGPLTLAFARQLLPNAVDTTAASIRAWAEQIVDASHPMLQADPPWRCHVWPRYGEGTAGQNRCHLIREAVRELLGRRHRQRRRRLDGDVTPFSPEHALVQVMLTAPDQGYLSLAPAPTPFQRRHLLATFPAGEVPVAVDKSAPSRAFAKLVEAEARLGVSIGAGQTCVDLGACPGSWSYVALRRGASVTAVDRSPLRGDLMEHPRLTFHPGDAFAFRPETPVDWLICDVIAAPERSLALLRQWLSEGWCRNFVVTVKFKGTVDYPLLDPLKAYLPTVCSDFRLTRLCANRNEVCVAGVAGAGHSRAS